MSLVRRVPYQHFILRDQALCLRDQALCAFRQEYLVAKFNKHHARTIHDFIRDGEELTVLSGLLLVALLA
jgi:hypothetical protein